MLEPSGFPYFIPQILISSTVKLKSPGEYVSSDGSSMNYSLLNLRAAYTFDRTVPVTIFVKVDNITNKHYEIIYGCPMPGTTLMGGVEFKF